MWAEIERLARDPRYSNEYIGNLVRAALDPMTDDRLAAVKTYLRPERALSPKSSEAIESVLRAAAEKLGEARYWVRMTVSTYVEARDKADAMQKGCDLVHPLVMEGRLGVHTVDAQWAPEYQPPTESPDV